MLDACASGAITRLKGGRQRQPFLVDESADMRGHAFLTSSSETEAAQESDRIGGSYFTHFLISGLRGAADNSGDGKVTLNEAYQFAFNETLGRTTDTKGGVQHPSYDINLSGTGEVVITDLRQTSATLVLGETLDGRFFVRNARQELVVELNKPYGRRIELGLEPGHYELRVEREPAAFLAKTEVGEGVRVVLEPAQFSPTRPEPTRRRGGFEAPSFAAAGRNRIDVRLGLWHKGSASADADVVAGTSNGDLLAGIRYTRFVREDLAFSAAFDLAPGESGAAVGGANVVAGSWDLFAIPVTAHWNPLQAGRSGALKPYLAFGLGPVIGRHQGTAVSGSRVFAGDRTEVTVGGHLGLGLDVHLGRGVSLGLDAGYRWMADFPEPVGSRDNYSGFSPVVLSGRADRHELWLSGASRCSARDLLSRRVDAALSGASYGVVQVSESLVVNASGASVLEYLGDPQLALSVSGESTVRRVGP